MTASMFRDIKVGAPVEADHVIGDLIARGDAAKVPVPKLRTAYTHLKAYEKQRGSTTHHVAEQSRNERAARVCPIRPRALQYREAR